MQDLHSAAKYIRRQIHITKAVATYSQHRKPSPEVQPIPSYCYEQSNIMSMPKYLSQQNKKNNFENHVHE